MAFKLAYGQIEEGVTLPRSSTVEEQARARLLGRETTQEGGQSSVAVISTRNPQQERAELHNGAGERGRAPPPS
jgi:hypothetical protein